jgi:hypothetical protein
VEAAVNRAALKALAQRCEQATAGQQADLIEDAFRYFYPPPNRMYSDATRLVYTRPWLAWSERFDRIEAMLTAEAYESAALTLVPEGWCLNGVSENGEGLFYGELRKTNVGDAHSTAPTLALAITAVALRAHAAKEASNAR